MYILIAVFDDYNVLMIVRQHKPSKKDREWQKKIEKNVKKEKIELDHPKGKERFEKMIKQISKKG